MIRLSLLAFVAASLTASVSHATPENLAQLKKEVGYELREAQSLLELRKTRVEEGLAYCSANPCLPGSSAHSLLNTVNLDKQIRAHFSTAQELNSYLYNWKLLTTPERQELYHFFMSLIEKLVVELPDAPGITYKVSTRSFVTSTSPPSSDPRDPLFARWGLSSVSLEPLDVSPTQSGISLRLFDIPAGVPMPDSLLGLPNPVHSEILTAANLQGHSGWGKPLWGSGFVTDHFGALLQFHLRVEQAGVHEIRFTTQQGYRLSMNGQAVAHRTQDEVLGLRNFMTTIYLKPGFYKIDLERFHRNEPGSHAMDYFTLDLRRDYGKSKKLSIQDAFID
jgi:hypothetical protein